ncbi:protein serine/threonine kinase, putative [Entamoeba invadens IP1]|uniref:Protein serine/threonine kinase, putative n=1 Tax=Entamoeba invadens IP1 TaxID=370355 RepID=A0A0A1TWB6_ENTIV|nr:protein serine/threonine kinase, putative [Entamoeba invadens IP1]ELP84797.1 protein serine/threonine kinase, putative [Entamoeba invadens IP1]|eukprot:XP_004184143.1 protein serine/threonine kinase, putative [Entamoeba invadens IP1]
MGLLFLLIGLSCGYWGEVNNEIRYNTGSSSSQWTVGYYSYDRFTFTSQCCTNAMKTFADTDLTSASSAVNRYFEFSSGVNMKYFFMRNRPKAERMYIKEENRPNNLVITFGCFGSNTNCRTSQYSNANPFIYVSDKGVVLYSKIDERFRIVYTRNVFTTVPLVYIDGDVSQSVEVSFSGFSLSNDFTVEMYLFTGKINPNSVTFIDSGAYADFKVAVVCYKRNIFRYMLVSTSQTEDFTNKVCGCIPTYYGLVDTSHNFPDCANNSTYFDLDLTAGTQWTFVQRSWNTVIVKEGVSNILTSSSTIILQVLSLSKNSQITFDSYMSISSLIFQNECKLVFNKYLYINFITVNSSTIPYGSKLFKHSGFTCYYCAAGEVIKCDDGYVHYKSCTCITGFNFLSNGLCETCHSTCEKCSGPLTTNCLSCGSGRYLQNGQCLSCDSNCYDIGPSCHNINGCIKCKDAFYINNKMCSPCNSNCNTCDGGTSSSCLSCKSGKYFVAQNKTCNDCDPNCAYGYCSTVNGCTKCIEGYFPQNYRCTKCGVTCKTCDIVSTNCLSCYNDSFIENNICITCEEGYCEVGYCLQEDGCTKCKSGYYKNGKRCLKCDTNCLTCGTTSTDCLSCASGLYLNDSTHQCIDCDSNCIDTSTHCTSPSGCTQCKDGFYINNKRCATCDNTCYTCNGNSSSNCLSCNLGRYLKYNNNCEICDINCLDNPNNCDVIKGCTKCAVGYFVNAKTCKSCDSQCRTCYGDLSYNCLSCKTGTYLDNYQCLSCDSKCVDSSTHCDTSTGCSKCVDGYYAYNKICDQCDSTCLTCDVISTNCTSCKQGTYLNNYNCVACDVNCKGITSSYCSTTEGCLDCVDGYYSSDKTCKKCDSNCKTCDQTSTQCLTCGNNYYLENSICKSCGEECKTCDSTLGCIMCNKGFYPESKTCSKCDSSCSDCTSLSDCQSCTDNTYLDNGLCHQCDSNCSATCDGRRGCLNCSEGYYPSNKICAACSEIPNCDKCSTTSKTCIKCNGLFEVSNGKCACLAQLQMYQSSSSSCEYCYNNITNCKACKNNETLMSQQKYEAVCEECYTPYVLVNGKCILCDNKIYNKNTKECDNYETNCTTQNDNKKCLKCQLSNYLLNGKCVQFTNSVCQQTSKITCEECGDGISSAGNCQIKNDLDISNCNYYKTQTNKVSCFQCEENSTLTSGVCVKDDSQNLMKNGNVFKCQNNNYLNSNNLCIKCSSKDMLSIYCVQSNNVVISTKCELNSLLDYTTSKCFSSINCGSFESNDCVKCKQVSSLINNICTTCSVTNCIRYDSNCKCIQCENTHLPINGNCLSLKQLSCYAGDGKRCTKCFDSYYFANTNMNNDNNHFCSKRSDVNTKYTYQKSNQDVPQTVECLKGFFPFENTCVSIQDYKKASTLKSTSENRLNTFYNNISYYTPYKSTSKSENIEDNTNCDVKTTKGCLQCSDGYFLTNLSLISTCEKCPSNCMSCFNTSYCLSCANDSVLNRVTNICEKSEDLTKKCRQVMPYGVGCAICRDGYYKSQSSCIECDTTCSVCNDQFSCLKCAPNHFKIYGESLLCLPFENMTNCENITQSGCIKCESGYYLSESKPLCYSCSVGCVTCIHAQSCDKCESKYIIIGLSCVHYSEIEYCENAEDSKCIKCKGDKVPSEDGASCIDKSKIAIYISIGIVCVFVILVIISIIVLIIILFRMHHKKTKELRKVCIFKMSRSNIAFVSKLGCISSNKKVLEFTGDDVSNEINVCEENRELICIGNSSKSIKKVQITVKDGCDQYSVRSVPPLVTLKKGFACEFEVFLTPNFSSNISDTIACVVLDIESGKEEVYLIKIKATTKMTTRIDYHELEEEKKLGEGSFGIVYKGRYRDKNVAIKKMKQMSESDTAQMLKEFEKEVDMLDKFRSDYIVHFYGAVFVPKKICMVTELAPYGSLNDLMKHKKDEDITKKMRVKFMLDASKGILYLHENGILHRDIKPDNILIVSLDFNTKVFGKLTDFGSSRNINLLTTNMTFTKGIGTPVYMAPEVLQQERYTKSADVYSLGITMFEAFTWQEAYPKEQFRFPWKIAEYVTHGKHPRKRSSITKEEYDLIQDCWTFRKEKRIKCEVVIDRLQIMVDQM